MTPGGSSMRLMRGLEGYREDMLAESMRMSSPMGEGIGSMMGSSPSPMMAMQRQQPRDMGAGGSGFGPPMEGFASPLTGGMMMHGGLSKTYPGMSQGMTGAYHMGGMESDHSSRRSTYSGPTPTKDMLGFAFPNAHDAFTVFPMGPTYPPASGDYISDSFSRMTYAGPMMGDGPSGFGSPLASRGQ
jgi:hypothetical protein